MTGTDIWMIEAIAPIERLLCSIASDINHNARVGLIVSSSMWNSSMVCAYAVQHAHIRSNDLISCE